ncbi:cell division protein SepF [archaeon]|nr:cell division protein SepF [archaeon]
MVKGFFEKLKKKISSPGYDELESEEGYLELDTNLAELKSKAVVRPFNVEDFDDLKPILDSLREGRTIALVNIKALRDKDMVELKRTVNKLKKTADAIDGEIAGFGEDYIIVTPSFATIHRDKGTKDVKADDSSAVDQDQE